MPLHTVLSLYTAKKQIFSAVFLSTFVGRLDLKYFMRPFTTALQALQVSFPVGSVKKEGVEREGKVVSSKNSCGGEI